jgi:hypothetical protein
MINADDYAIEILIIEKNRLRKLVEEKFIKKLVDSNIPSTIAHHKILKIERAIEILKECD